MKRRKIFPRFNLKTQNKPCKDKGTAVPVQVWTDLDGSRRLRFSDLMIIGTRKWSSCQPYAPAAFTPRKYSWYSFLPEAEQIPRP
jgi:hypothetical protein